MLVNKLVSTFGDHTSLYPIFTKDVANSLGITAFSYDAGGEIEAKDRFIDEFGTMAIWIGGLPLLKKAFDMTAYKAAKLNPGIDVRLIKDKDQLSVAKKYAEQIAKNLKKADINDSLLKAEKKSKLFKGLFLTKFAAATALTLGAFFTLVKVKQTYTKKQIEKDFWNKKTEEYFHKNNVANSSVFNGFLGQTTPANAAKAQKTNGKNVSFKGAASFLSGFMFDPVKNLFLVDAGITGERLTSSRTKTEFVEYSIKEGSLLFFMYVAGRYIQKGVEVLSDKVFNRPVELKAELLNSQILKDAIKNKTALKDASKFTALYNKCKEAKDFTPLYEFIHNPANQENLIVKAAKRSDVIKTIKEEKVAKNFIQKIFNKFKCSKSTGIIDPHQYINPAEMADFTKHIKKIAKTWNSVDKNAGASKITLESFLKSCSRFKVASVVGNLGLSCLFLGIIVPYAMMKYRQKQQNGKKEFHVQNQIQQELEKNFKGRIEGKI